MRLIAVVMALHIGGCGPNFDDCGTVECCQNELELCSDDCDDGFSGRTGVEKSACYASCTQGHNACVTRVTRQR
jgi:hypothetical protein